MGFIQHPASNIKHPFPSFKIPKILVQKSRAGKGSVLTGGLGCRAAPVARRGAGLAPPPSRFARHPRERGIGGARWALT